MPGQKADALCAREENVAIPDFPALKHHGMICETDQDAQVKPLCDPNGEPDVPPRREVPFPSQCGSVEKVALLAERCQFRKLNETGPFGVFNAGRAGV